jgi:hypothetical protein
MIHRIHYNVILILVIAALLTFTLGCNSDERENIKTTFEQYYTIDPRSLLNSLVQDGANLFSPIDTEPELPPPDQQVTVNWSQADYLRIVDALYRNIWQEPLDGWSLSNMSFALGCNKIDNGFQNAQFDFFQNVKKQDLEIRIVRFINIDPRSESVYVLESEYSPRLTTWETIDLVQIRFSAKDALMIAEQNGGREKRISVGNSCDISVVISPGSASYRGWDVRYSNKNDSRIFRIQIDPLTGHINFP